MPGNAPIQSVQRAARILHAVAGSDDGRTVAQIAAAAGLRLHTAYKFIRTLEAEHLLQRRTHPLRFLLGRGIAELKHLDDERHLLTLGGRLLIRAQARLPSASLVLLEPDGPNTYQRLGVFADRPGVLVKRRDFKVDPYSKASSLLFLAHATPETAAAFFRRHPFAKTGRAIWKTRACLDTFLEKIRRDGYALPDFPDNAEKTAPLFRLAVPVFAPDQSLAACIAGFLPDTAIRTAKNNLITLCRTTASDLTAGLRASPTAPAAHLRDRGTPAQTRSAR